MYKRVNHFWKQKVKEDVWFVKRTIYSLERVQKRFVQRL